MTEYSRFKELHNQPRPLIIGNVWNVKSAKVFEKLAFEAIGTSSAAVAHTLGYEDGEQMPFSDLLFVVERIRRSVSLPLTVDIEFGYGVSASEIASNVISLQKLGVAGINIEDSFIENGRRALKDYSQFSHLLREIKRLLEQSGVSIFINVRCDAFLLDIPNKLQVALERVGKYGQVGADGVFLPCITDKNDIVTVVSQTILPLNVMCMPDLPDFDTLKKIGVKRVSMGNYLNSYAYTSMENMASKILVDQSFNALFER
jgi:2-methylisocitrate lyase-like PEP mutase family enzyme